MDFEGDKISADISGAKKDEEERLLKEIADAKGYGFLPISASSLLNMKALVTLEEDEATEGSLVVFRKSSKKIDVAARDFDDKKTASALEKLEDRGFTISKYLATNETIERLLGFYHDVSPGIVTKSGLVDVSEEENQRVFDKIESVEDVEAIWNDVIKNETVHKTSKLIKTIFIGAVKLGASDIHIEPFESEVVLRYRLDSVLVVALRFDIKNYNAMISRIKILSKLKLNIRNVAQDGRFSIQTPVKSVDIRLSVVPGPSGESVVMRLLDPDKINIEIEGLGIHPVLLKEFRKQITRPNGMIITTGPTGSGKTTTLYSFMKEVLDPKVKIITIENPIEYKIKGLIQTQVEKNYSFADGLRAALRQDPDIILVGEIRTLEEAEVALQASLTGHIVFTTLHTNDAIGAIPRLIDLGIDAKTLPDSVNLIIAQRLIRKLNPETKVKAQLNEKEKEEIETIFNSISDEIKATEKLDWDNIYEAPEEETKNYKGIIGLYEAIVITEDLFDAITSGDTRNIRSATEKQGLLTLKQDAILKLTRGVTSIEEVKRVIDFYE